MRIVALSDQHGYLPEVPACDLLVVGGDVCPDQVGPIMAARDPNRQRIWFDDTVRPWLAGTPAVHKVLTWGNHDWCGQACSFREDSPRYARTTDLQILVDEQTIVPAAGPGERDVTVWATPWSNTFMRWAFMKEPRDLEPVYAAIPEGIDILVSHQPPYGHVDEVFDPVAGRLVHLGSRELLAAIERVRPKVVVCGHIHGGFGRSEHEGIPIYNVSILDERYRLENAPTVIELAVR